MLMAFFSILSDDIKCSKHNWISCNQTSEALTHWEGPGQNTASSFLSQQNWKEWENVFHMYLGS